MDKELRDFLHKALGVWEGPATASDTFARRQGFGDAAAFSTWRRALMVQLEAGADLSPAEMGRILPIARIAVFDDYYGAGWEWTLVTPYSQDEAEKLRQQAEVEV
ncbi:hypothetical protein [Paenarthrobacter sp. C1]|uniref:hypothetical protein n=1 Tax=Paenarthrobacter sp. C1 TaxID=3400220 RepID=UPI003BF471E9